MTHVVVLIVYMMERGNEVRIFGSGAANSVIELIQREYHSLHTHTATLLPLNTHTELTLSGEALAILEIVVWCGVKQESSDTYINYANTQDVSLTRIYHTYVL